MDFSFSLSSLSSLVTGIPVHIDTTSDMSSIVTCTASLVLSVSKALINFSTLADCSSSSSLNFAAFSYCCPEMAFSFHFLVFSNSFFASLNSGGTNEFFIRTLEPASSIRSIALSGKVLCLS